MKTLALVLSVAAIVAVALPVNASDRYRSDGYRSHHNHKAPTHRHYQHPPAVHRHHRAVHRHHYRRPAPVVNHYHYPRSSSRNAEYLVGGVMLGVLLNELSSGHRQTTTTTTTTYVDTRTPTLYGAEEYLLRDGLCYSVSYQGATRVLTQVPTYECRY